MLSSGLFLSNFVLFCFSEKLKTQKYVLYFRGSHFIRKTKNIEKFSKYLKIRKTQNDFLDKKRK
jgi:hypothetical protein